MTFRDAELIFIDHLTSVYDKQEALSINWLCISFLCKINRTQYLNLKYQEIPLAQHDKLFEILDELKTGTPVQYILGETEFYGLNFNVNPAVLIPRPETEELVDWILSDQKTSQTTSEDLKIIDIGTGSACIAISLKKNLPLADVYGLDISSEALKTARGNAIKNQTKLSFIEDSILNPIKEELIKAKFSLIISNPPYVTNTEKSDMKSNVLDYEPHLALFVSDNDALVFYRAIANYAIQHLEDKGFLYLEINENLGAATLELLKENGFIHIELRQDLRGKDRMIKAQLANQDNYNLNKFNK